MSTAWWCRNGYLKQWKGCLRWEEAVKAVYISEVIKLHFCPDFERKVWSRFWSWSSGKICSWSLATFLRWYFVEVMKLNLGRDFEARFGQDFEVLWRGWCLVEILKLMLGRDSEDETWSRFVFELVIWPQEITLVKWTQPSGPLCLWQCFWFEHSFRCKNVILFFALFTREKGPK